MTEVKKHLRFILAVIIFMSYVITHTTLVSAAGNATFMLSNTTVAVNERSNITLSVSTNGAAIQSGDVKVNFPSNVKFESYTPRFTPFDAFNAEIFNKPSGSNFIIITFISNDPVTEGVIGTIQISGMDVGTDQITLSEGTANDATQDARAMSIDVVNSSVTIVSEAVSQLTNPTDIPVLTSTALVPTTSSFTEPPSETPEPTNSGIQESVQTGDVSLENVTDISASEVESSSNSLLEIKTEKKSSNLGLLIFSSLLTIIILIFTLIVFVKKKTNKSVTI